MRQTVNPQITDTIRPLPRRTRSKFTLSIAFAAVVLFAALAPAAKAQGSRKDDIVLGTTGHPVAGATVRVCQATATGTPCSPLATIYTSAAMTVTAPNPFQADGLGNYHFYAPAGRYMIQLTGPGITGTVTQPDVILAPDVSSTGSGNNISAFGLNLGGNLSVAGNATINGTLTSGSFSPGIFAPSSLQVNGNSCQAGPRPYIDVTCPAYGAKGDSQTDDTAAISAALTAACATTTAQNGLAMHPAVVFPPGVYRVQQPQTPSAAAPLSIPCGFIELRGFPGGNAASGSQPASQITVTPGSSPNAAPLIMVTNVGTVRFTNLSIQGYNQAVWLRSALGNIVFDNAPLAATGTTGLADNTALKISNTILVWRINHSSAQVSGSATTPPVIYAAETPVFSEGPTVGIIYTRDVSDAGGAEQVICRVAGCVIGNFHFNDIENEDSNNGFITFTNTSGVSANDYPIFTFDNVTISDSTVSAPFLNFNDPLSQLTGVRMNYVLGAGNVAIQVTAGHLIGYDVQGECHTAGVCSWEVVDGSGNAIGTGRTTEQFGALDHTSDASFEIASPTSGLFSGAPSVADRWCASGGVYCSLGMDPTFGVLFGLGDSNAFNAGLKQTSAETLDVQFANFLPPTAFSGSATTGGTLAAGTYYAQIWTTANADCATTFSAPTYASGVVVGGSNNAVNFSWTNPIATPGTGSISGHCLSIQTTPIAVSSNTGQHLFVSGAGATSFLYTGQAQPSGAPAPSNQMVSEHRFTNNSLGVNTTNPQFNLDVNGSAAVNSLNGVQKAERFSGSDVAAKINACLTAASASSGICDAHGLTGTLTGTSHIAIPAGTTLLWGQAQLTINDTTTNDAVELLGDGSSLIGYQESGSGTVPRPDTSGFIACQPTGCTAVKNPNAATRNVDWVHLSGMYLKATGSGSVVLNLTSVGHADIENNRLVMGTGGSSYGIFGDTSTGGFDSTNTLIKHNEFDPQFQNDRCLHLAGVFNVVEMEQNTCVLPAANTGTVCFELAKDSNNNYPDNDEFYGNDCEGSSTSFGQIGYNIINADSITIGPNNRCENVYNCFQFPVDGSAVGIHVLDPFISVSANSVVKPNEPSTSQIAIDNNGPNWLPSMHFGINDIAGRNLLGNAAFEGWSSSTALYYWGGVSGTNINQAGSGIYSQNSSAGTPADATTQGSFNVKIGDNATAGLGVNSGCIQVDATMNYTLALRIAASSTSINFRPGFRFYSDPNCTEANKITNVATNARVLTPANYAGTSVLVGTGPNWQSANASLTYNNGITCNCNVTAADWQVATASTWTPTRNFAITFRAPNAFSSGTTVAQSMRVFIMENTAANPNQIFVDDAVLSEGPVNPRVPFTAPVSDSVNPTVYGNLSVAGNLTVGASALPATLTSGTPASGDCAAFTSGTVTNVQDSGSPCPTLFTRFAMGIASAGQAPSAANAVDVSVVYLPNIQFSHVTVDVSTTDSSTSDFYSWAITDTSGNVKCSIAAVNITAGGANDQSCTQGTVTLAAGAYIFAFTGNATTGKIAYSGTAPLALSSAVSSSTSSSGAMTFPISAPAAGVTYSSYGLPAIILH
jgi:pectate lyase-like protein